jgi:betaine reductase|tara:strand:- start:216 stop:482 length:267 start_codon:yes stop_codon:yes gene_type:complete
VVVILGTPTADSSKIYALTVTEGDPTWAGSLAGASFGLPVYHILESEMKAAVDSRVYEAEVGVAEMILEEAETIVEVVREVREKNTIV